MPYSEDQLIHVRFSGHLRIKKIDGQQDSVSCALAKKTVEMVFNNAMADFREAEITIDQRLGVSAEVEPWPDEGPKGNLGAEAPLDNVVCISSAVAAS